MEKKSKSTTKKPTKKVVKKPTTTKKTKLNSKKKRGFTLIELLAVIIILGILMIIAIPSVTNYINDSRKSAYVDTAKEIVSGTRNLVNEGKLGMYDTGTTYYIPAKYVNTENGLKSPYGEFTDTSAYVGVIYDGQGYKYYWISSDDAGQGVPNITLADKLDTDDIVSDLKPEDIKSTIENTGIGDRTTIKILKVDGTWEDQIALSNTDNNVSEDGAGGNGSGNAVDPDEGKIKCDPGTYLAKSSETCANCPSGSYCPGGKYLYNENDNQGIAKCPIGSYSYGSSPICSACQGGTTTYYDGSSSCYYNCRNSFGAKTWKTSSWTPNQVNNLCQIDSCKTISNGSFTLNNNVCELTGTVHTYLSSTINVGKNLSDLSLTDNVGFLSWSELAKEAKYINVKSVVENNVIKSFELCFKINGNGIYVSGGKSGNYCFKVPFDNNINETYQYNVNILKSIFGSNFATKCSENSDGYVCTTRRATYLGYEFKVLKNGMVSVYHDDPNSDSSSMENPYCYVDVNKIARCPSSSCLSGDTIVEVYDEKKKRRYKKKLKDVTKDDLILCWDFDSCKIVFVEPLWIKKIEIMHKYYLLEFSDGSSLKIVGDHKVFDADRNLFVNAGTDNELKVGSHVFNSNGELVELVSRKLFEEEIESYNIITNHHINIFANGILTSCVFSNIYPIKDMKYIEEDIERLTNEDLEEIDEKYIEGLRLNEVPTNFRGSKEETISYVKNYVQKLISKEK
jgi:prepilin-type N-terminal cleavage/methylation domain-containing protein